MQDQPNGATMHLYEKEGCSETKTKKSTEEHIERCANLFRRLDGKSVDCICPPDPSTDRTCGIPMNFDLYSKEKMNGLLIETTNIKSLDESTCTEVLIIIS